MKKNLYNNKLFKIGYLIREGGRIKGKAQMILLAGIIIAVTIATMGVIVSSISGARVTAILEKPNPIFLEYKSLRDNFKELFIESCKQRGFTDEDIEKAFNYTKNALGRIEYRYGRFMDAELLRISDDGYTIYAYFNLTLSSLGGSVTETISMPLYVRR